MSLSWTDSPYFGICIRPRGTIRTIVDHDPTDRVITIVMAAAVIGAVANIAHNYNPTAFTIAGKAIPVMAPGTSKAILLWTAISWLVLAVPFLYIEGVLLQWSGALLGGNGKAVELRAAIAWPRVLTIAGSLVAILMPLFAPASPTFPMIPSTHALLAQMRQALPYVIVSVPLTVWSTIVELKCIGEVHRFSAWHALGASLIALLVVAGIALVALLIIGVVQAVAVDMTDDPIVRALSLAFASVVLMGLLVGLCVRSYLRTSA